MSARGNNNGERKIWATLSHSMISLLALWKWITTLSIQLQQFTFPFWNNITLNFKKYKSTITLESRIKELYIKQCIVSKVDVTETGNIPFLQLQNSFLIIGCWTTLVDKSFIHNESIVLNKVIIIQGIVTPPPQCTRAELKTIYFLDSQEPSNKRVRPLAKVSSLVNLISPSKNGAVRRFGHTIQVNVILIWYSTNLSCRNLNE